VLRRGGEGLKRGEEGVTLEDWYYVYLNGQMQRQRIVEVRREGRGDGARG